MIDRERSQLVNNRTRNVKNYVLQLRQRILWRDRTALTMHQSMPLWPDPWMTMQQGPFPRTTVQYALNSLICPQKRSLTAHRPLCSCGHVENKPSSSRIRPRFYLSKTSCTSLTLLSQDNCQGDKGPIMMFMHPIDWRKIELLLQCCRRISKSFSC
jgi:hypothetical protein